MAGKVSQAKAKEILKHGEVRGHPLTEKQKGFFGARAGGAPYKNAPLFPTGLGETETPITPQEREPLTGPSDATVGNPTGAFAAGTAKAFSPGAFEVDAPHPDAPIQESDFPVKAGFTDSTGKAFDP